jgi:hypothetical protein
MARGTKHKARSAARRTTGAIAACNRCVLSGRPFRWNVDGGVCRPSPLSKPLTTHRHCKRSLFVRRYVMPNFTQPAQDMAQNTVQGTTQDADSGL